MTLPSDRRSPSWLRAVQNAMNVAMGSRMSDASHTGVGEEYEHFNG
jgi:hypothetical protein